MVLTEEQRKQAEANRLEAIERRKAVLEARGEKDHWQLFKCRKISSESIARPTPTVHPHQQHQSVSVEPVSAASLPHKFLVMPSHYTQNHDGRNACVYNLRDYHTVLKCLKIATEIEGEEIPRETLIAVQAFSHFCGTERWIPCTPEHLSDDKVDELIGKLPRTLLDALLPFQRDGLRFGLRRGARCLIADEMGLGKTLQNLEDSSASNKMMESPEV